MYYVFIKQYSYHRIKQIFRDDYDMDLVKATGYKAYRYGKPIRYSLVLRSTGEIIMRNVTLNALREYLTSENYDLHENEENNTERG